MKSNIFNSLPELSDKDFEMFFLKEELKEKQKSEKYVEFISYKKGEYWFKYKDFKFPISSKNFKNLKVFKYNSFDDTFKKYYDEYLLDIEKENKVNM